MSGEVSIIITMVAVGVALTTVMFTLFRLQDRRFDERFTQAREHTDQRFDEVNRRMNDRFAEVNRRIDETNQRVAILESDFKEFRKDMGEVKGSLNTIHKGLRIEVGQPAE